MHSLLKEQCFHAHFKDIPNWTYRKRLSEVLDEVTWVRDSIVEKRESKLLGIDSNM